ncbi:MAG: hypothetical protein AAF517_22760 [Planctomycetota bacterium]
MRHSIWVGLLFVVAMVGCASPAGQESPGSEAPQVANPEAAPKTAVTGAAEATIPSDPRFVLSTDAADASSAISNASLDGANSDEVAAPQDGTTTEPTFYSWPHHKRRLRKIVDGLHEMHMDIDRIIFDMEPYPVEVDY